jgi:hypothetical protein
MKDYRNDSKKRERQQAIKKARRDKKTRYNQTEENKK